jgi:hypothetical protein
MMLGVLGVQAKLLHQQRKELKLKAKMADVHTSRVCHVISQSKHKDILSPNRNIKHTKVTEHGGEQSLLETSISKLPLIEECPAWQHPTS